MSDVGIGESIIKRLPNWPELKPGLWSRFKKWWKRLDQTSKWVLAFFASSVSGLISFIGGTLTQDAGLPVAGVLQTLCVASVVGMIVTLIVVFRREPNGLTEEFKARTEFEKYRERFITLTRGNPLFSELTAVFNAFSKKALPEQMCLKRQWEENAGSLNKVLEDMKMHHAAPEQCDHIEGLKRQAWSRRDAIEAEVQKMNVRILEATALAVSVNGGLEGGAAIASLSADAKTIIERLKQAAQEADGATGDPLAHEIDSLPAERTLRLVSGEKQ